MNVHKGEFYGRHDSGSAYFIVEVFSDPYGPRLMYANEDPSLVVDVETRNAGDLGQSWAFEPARFTVPVGWFDDLVLVQLTETDVAERRANIEHARIHGLPPIRYVPPVYMP